MEKRSATRTNEAGKKKRKKGPKTIRPHVNPLNDREAEPFEHDWRKYYPEFLAAHPTSEVEFADIGCGFGGLLLALGENYPNTLSLGLEIRIPVVQVVQSKIDKLRLNGNGHNVAVLESNVMKYLPHYFHKHQLSKMFFLFADPQFKKRLYNRRIISNDLLAEYAYVLKPGGRLYTITDVPDLHQWQTACLDAHPLFRRLTDEELEGDIAAKLILDSSEESKKVKRENRTADYAIYERVVRTQS